MESWAEKYRPKSLSDIIGNTKVINDLKSWAGSWGEKMVKKGVILSGPPGCGKTEIAQILADIYSKKGYDNVVARSVDNFSVSSFDLISISFFSSGPRILSWNLYPYLLRILKILSCSMESIPMPLIILILG